MFEKTQEPVTIWLKERKFPSSKSIFTSPTKELTSMFPPATIPVTALEASDGHTTLQSPLMQRVFTSKKPACKAKASGISKTNAIAKIKILVSFPIFIVSRTRSNVNRRNCSIFNCWIACKCLV